MSDKLDSIFNGVTHTRSSLPLDFISDSGWLNSNEYFLQCPSLTNQIFNGKFLIGSVQRVNEIDMMILSFHDKNNNVLQDEMGALLQYQATRLDLGHLFEILQREFDYAYARILLKLRPNSNFDPNLVFFSFCSAMV